MLKRPSRSKKSKEQDQLESTSNNQEEFIAQEQPETPTFASRIIPFLVLIVLSVTDFAIQQLLRTRANERTIQPTKRSRFPRGTKQQLFQRQNRQCVICGKRRLIKNFQIDHIHPAVRGGSNNIPNLQLLCAPCNQRKGIQTNQEFYNRYQTVASSNMLKSPPQPPPAEISQQAFREETTITSAHSAVQQFKKTKYISAQTKIKGGSLIIGASAGAIWLFGIYLIFPNGGDTQANIALFGGIILGAIICIGIIWRAKYTGMYEQ